MNENCFVKSNQPAVCVWYPITCAATSSTGADRMIFVSGFEQVGVQFFEKQAASQGWKPHYAVTSPAGTGYNDMQLGDEALSRIQGVGWRPAKDVTQLPTTPAASRCKSLFRQYSGALDRANESASFSLCEAFFFLEAGLERSSGRSDPATLTAAWNGLGTSFASPLELAGATSFAPGHKDGPRYFSTYSFITGCSCFRYTGGPRALA